MLTFIINVVKLRQKYVKRYRHPDLIPTQFLLLGCICSCKLVLFLPPTPPPPPSSAKISFVLPEVNKVRRKWNVVALIRKMQVSALALSSGSVWWAEMWLSWSSCHLSPPSHSSSPPSPVGYLPFCHSFFFHSTNTPITPRPRVSIVYTTATSNFHSNGLPMVH